MNLPVLIFVMVTVLAGVGTTYYSGVRIELEARVGVGTIVGAMSVTVASLLWAWPLGFGVASVTCGAVTASVLAAGGWAKAVPTMRADAADLRRRIDLPWRNPASIRPLVVLVVVSWATTLRVLHLAYITDDDGGIVAGHLSSYADWNAHLAYLGSFVYGDNTSNPMLPFASGHRLTYHVGVDVFAANAAVLGVPATTALVVTSALLAMAFPLVFWFAGTRVAASRSVTVVAYALFTMSGGLGFAYAIVDIARGGFGVLGALPRSYSRMPEHSIWVDNWVLSSMYAQRPGLIALPVVLIVVAVVWTHRDDVAVRPYIAAGVLAGASTGFSVFGFGGALLFGAWLARGAGRRLVAFVVPAVVLALPVLFLLRPESSNWRWQFGWMSRTLEVPWPWFWLINLGLFVPLGVVALFRPKSLPNGFGSAIVIPAWTIFIVMNLVVLHPWEWNNTHYFVVWALMISFPVAGLLVSWLRDRRRTVQAIGCACVVSLVLAGGLDIWRAFDGSEGRGVLTDAEGVEAASWAREVTPPHSVFVVAPVITQPFVSFGARRVVTGFSGWVWDLGLTDWSQRVDDSTAVLRGSGDVDRVIERYGVDYVVLGPNELAEPYRADRTYWDSNGLLVYSSPSYRIYAVRS